MTYHIDFSTRSCGVYFDHDEETGATKRHNADGSITAGKNTNRQAARLYGNSRTVRHKSNETMNKKHPALIVGYNKDTTRADNDFYATDPKSVEQAYPLLLQCGLGHKVWECACGKGHIAKVLKAKGHEVKCTDLIYYGYGEVQDFLFTQDKWDGDILTNPPFKLAREFVERALMLIDNGRRVFMFLKIQFLEGLARRELFNICPPVNVLVYSGRQFCAKDGDFSKPRVSMLTFAWFVFQKGYKGPTTIKWI